MKKSDTGALGLVVYRVLVVLNLTLLPFWAGAQYSLNNELSAVYIEGTSTLHDWKVIVEEVKGDLKVELSNSQIKNIKGVQISIPVKSIKSGKSKMDDIMYEALKVEEAPRIRYQLKGYSMEGRVVTTTGELTVAEETKTVKCDVNYSHMDDYLKFTGILSLKMSEFNIKPPEFLFGAFTTGNEVEVNFDLIFSNIKENQ